MKGFKRVIAATFLLAIMLTPLVFIQPMVSAKSLDAFDWYNVNPLDSTKLRDGWTGVLATEKNLLDSEADNWPEGLGTLYPFETDGTLEVGFSKFGEMINPYAMKGFSYKGRDIFYRGYPPLQKTSLINGWLIRISYTASVYSPADRCVWAFAMFADGVEWGGDWVTVPGNGGGPAVEAPVPGLGGRQTNTFCESEPIRYLYEGPRRSVAVLVTHVYDGNIDPQTGNLLPPYWWPVVDIYFTIIFNKVKKEIIILKDICYKLPQKEILIDVKFSNREEVDIGPDADSTGYSHFWHQKFSTCYGGNWLKTKWILRENTELHDYSYVTQPNPPIYRIGDLELLECPVTTGLPAVQNQEKIWLNGVLQIVGSDYEYYPKVGDALYTQLVNGIPWHTYWEEKAFTGIRWLKVVPCNAIIKLEYKNIMKELRKPVYMLWPTTEMIHMDQTESHKYDLAQFISSDNKFVAFKAYWPTLSSYTLNGWQKKFQAIEEPLLTKWCNEQDMPGEPAVPFVIGQWDFCLKGTTVGGDTQFRAVEVLGMVDFHDADDYNANDLNLDGKKENQVDTEAYYQLQEVFNPWDLNDATGGDPHFGKNTRSLVQYFIGKGGTGSETGTEALANIIYFKLQYPPYHHPEWRDESDRTGIPGDPNKGGDDGTSNDIDPANKYGTYEYWYRYCTFAERVLVNGVLMRPHSGSAPMQTGQYTLVKNPFTAIPPGPPKGVPDPNAPQLPGWYIKFRSTAIPATGAKIKVLYSPAEDADTVGTLTTTLGGVDTFSDYSITVTDNKWKANWEWIIVGRDSAPVDSAGSAMITEFFKDKQMPVLWSGLDMKDVTNAPRTPFVMVKLRTGDTKDAYKAEDETVPCTGRSTLKDDWCRTVPVKSSNLISVGGPNANMLTRYFNDFTNAYWESKTSSIRALTCWSKNKYTSVKGTTGYAVVSTYKDIDGTIGFLVWGVNGEDTYWASWWLWHFGWKLQKEPDCVTDIILKFDYTKLDVTAPSSGPWDSAKYKPGECFWEVVETLGTISEFNFGIGGYEAQPGGYTETTIVFEFTAMASETVGGVTTYYNYLASKLPAAGTRTITLYGCWLPLTGDVIAIADAAAPTKTGVNIIQYDWSSSPFWMCKKTPTPVMSRTVSIDWVTGRISSSTDPAVKIKFYVKQPPIHPCNQLANLPPIV